MKKQNRATERKLKINLLKQLERKLIIVLFTRFLEIFQRFTIVNSLLITANVFIMLSIRESTSLERMQEGPLALSRVFVFFGPRPSALNVGPRS